MAELACPQCGTVADLEEGEQSFCENCDYPLFMASRSDTADGGAGGAGVGRGEIDLDAQATDIICRNCAERNPGYRTFCQRCGEELIPPRIEDFEPDSPVLMAEFPPPRDSSAKILAGIVIAVVLAAVLGGGFFAYRQAQGERPVIVMTLDDSGDTGFSTAMAYAEDGPEIAYRTADKVLRFIDCTKPDCSERHMTRLVPQGDPGYDMAMDLVGPPVVLYRELGGKTLAVVRCGNHACDNSTGQRRFNLVDPDDAGVGTSVAVSGGIAIAAYRTGAGAVRTALLCMTTCGEDDGTIIDKGTDNGRAITTIDPGNGVPPKPGRAVAIAVPTAGRPYLAYRDETTLSVRLVRCETRSCSRSHAVTIASGDVGYEPAMVIGREGYPVVAYRDQEKNAVVLIACGDVACSPDTRTTTVLDTGGEKADKVGFNLVMVKDGESRPLVLYRNDTTGALNLMQCGDSACTGPKRTHRIVDGHAAGSKVGFETSAVVSGNVLYAVYRDENAKSLKLARVRLTSRGRYRPAN